MNDNITNRENIFEFFKGPNSWTQIDNWVPVLDKDVIFKTLKNVISLPVSNFYGVKPNPILDNFIITPKRCYNTKEVRQHICHYMNYFEKYYDTDHELLMIYYRIKYLIDFGMIDMNGNTYQYELDNFLSDIQRYVLSENMYRKVWKMDLENYICLEKQYKNKSNEALQYTDTHCKYLMQISIFQNMLIPLISHFCYSKKIINASTIDEIFYTVYNWLFERYIDKDKMEANGLKCADIYNKLYETSNTTMMKNYKSNQQLWNMSEIRGMEPTINSLDAANTIILQVIPKYKFNSNIVMYNFTAVNNTAKFNVSDIAYEFDYKSLSSSKRDGEDNTSQFDKYESYMIRNNEADWLQTQVNMKMTMDIIINQYGKVSQEEIEFYKFELSKGGKPVLNNFQMKLISLMFNKKFGDTISIKNINQEQYITLMVIAKRILLSQGMILLPYIISGRITRLITRNSINKRETTKLETSELYPMIQKKYNYEQKTMDMVLSTVATILSSDFEIVDYNKPNLNGCKIILNSDILIDEILNFIIMI